jgi:hypothetical protein
MAAFVALNFGWKPDAFRFFTKRPEKGATFLRLSSLGVDSGNVPRAAF